MTELRRFTAVFKQGLDICGRAPSLDRAEEIVWESMGGYYGPDTPIGFLGVRWTTTEDRLEYLRGEILAERISYYEIAELQGLADHIQGHDTLLLEWAGVPEHGDEEGAA